MRSVKSKRLLLAVLAAALSLADAAGSAQLLPAGEFAARDGRPGPGKKWKLSDAQGAKLAATLNALAARTPIVIDYDHQTLHVEKNGQKAPAAGWIKQTEWRPGQGLFATVEWTAAAKAHIDAREYLYISPVIVYDADGNVTGLLMAALLNYPGLVGMDAVIAELSGLPAHHPQEPPEMDLLTKICALFALAAGTTPEACMAHLTALKAQLDGTAALKAKLGLPETADLQGVMNKVVELQGQLTGVASLKTKLGLSEATDLQGLIGHVEALKASIGKPDAATLASMALMQTQIAALTTQINGDKVTGMVDQALKDGKLLPAMRDWALELGKKDFAALQGYIAQVPATALGSMQSGGKEAAGDGGKAALSATQSDVIAKLGISAEAFAKAATTTA